MSCSSPLPVLAACFFQPTCIFIPATLFTIPPFYTSAIRDIPPPCNLLTSHIRFGSGSLSSHGHVCRLYQHSPFSDPSTANRRLYTQHHVHHRVYHDITRNIITHLRLSGAYQDVQSHMGSAHGRNFCIGKSTTSHRLSDRVDRMRKCQYEMNSSMVQ